MMLPNHLNIVNFLQNKVKCSRRRISLLSNLGMEFSVVCSGFAFLKISALDTSLVKVSSDLKSSSKGILKTHLYFKYFTKFSLKLPKAELIFILTQGTSFSINVIKCMSGLCMLSTFRLIEFKVLQ